MICIFSIYHYHFFANEYSQFRKLSAHLSAVEQWRKFFFFFQKLVPAGQEKENDYSSANAAIEIIQRLINCRWFSFKDFCSIH